MVGVRGVGRKPRGVGVDAVALVVGVGCDRMSSRSCSYL